MRSTSDNDAPEVHPGQTKIEGDKLMPAEPKDRDCEVCGEQATHRFEFTKRIKNAKGLVGRGMFAYACDKHAHMTSEACLPPSMRGK